MQGKRLIMKFPIRAKHKVNGTIVEFYGVTNGKTIKGNNSFPPGEERHNLQRCDDSEFWTILDVPAPILEMTLTELFGGFLVAQIIIEKKEWRDQLSENSANNISATTENLSIYANSLSFPLDKTTHTHVPEMTSRSNRSRVIEWITEAVEKLEVRPGKPECGHYKPGFTAIHGATGAEEEIIYVDPHGHASHINSSHLCLEKWAHTHWKMPCKTYRVETEVNGIVTTLRVVEICKGKG